MRPQGIIELKIIRPYATTTFSSSLDVTEHILKVKCYLIEVPFYHVGALAVATAAAAAAT